MHRDDFKIGDRVVVIDWPEYDSVKDMVGRLGTVCEAPPAFSPHTLTATHFVDVKMDDDPRYTKASDDDIVLFLPTEIEVI